MTEWIYRGSAFDVDDVLPDGSRPAELLDEWGPWVRSCVRLLSDKGTYSLLPVAGGMYDQPATDMMVFDVIRSRWNELRNRDEEERMKKMNGGPKWRR